MIRNAFIGLPIEEQDKSSDIEQQPPFSDRKYSNTLPQKRGIQLNFGIEIEIEVYVYVTKILI